MSFNIALNDMSEYEGGGTWIARFAKDDPPGSIRSDRGHVLAHASGMLHGGHEVESGVRYILVCFVILKNFANFATRFYRNGAGSGSPRSSSRCLRGSRGGGLGMTTQK